MRSNILTILKEEGLWNDISIASILDVGCGISLQSQHWDVPIRVALDIHRPFLKHILADEPYIPLNADAMDIGKLFLPDSFDMVLLADVVEHLPIPKSLALLDMARIIARVYVVVSTPKGYLPQDIDIWGYGGDYYQTHRCGYNPDTLISNGYSVVERPYTMSDVTRCSTQAVDPHVTMLYAVLRKDND